MNTAVNWGDVCVRAAKTFIQVAIVTLAIFPEPWTKSALLAAATAGVSAAWNIVRDIVSSRKA
jgi:hypothetical protein